MVSGQLTQPFGYRGFRSAGNANIETRWTASCQRREAETGFCWMSAPASPPLWPDSRLLLLRPGDAEDQVCAGPARGRPLTHAGCGAVSGVVSRRHGRAGSGGSSWSVAVGLVEPEPDLGGERVGVAGLEHVGEVELG